MNSSRVGNERWEFASERQVQLFVHFSGTLRGLSLRIHFFRRGDPGFDALCFIDRYKISRVS